MDGSRSKIGSGFWSSLSSFQCTPDYRDIGTAEALMAKSTELGQRWMKGVSGERALLILLADSSVADGIARLFSPVTAQANAGGFTCLEVPFFLPEYTIRGRAGINCLSTN